MYARSNTSLYLGSPGALTLGRWHHDHHGLEGCGTVRARSERLCVFDPYWNAATWCRNGLQGLWKRQPMLKSIPSPLLPATRTHNALREILQLVEQAADNLPERFRTVVLFAHDRRHEHRGNCEPARFTTSDGEGLAAPRSAVVEGGARQENWPNFVGCLSFCGQALRGLD
jgi:hypothetical protein